MAIQDLFRRHRARPAVRGKPVVGLVGYFRFGNFGDELFVDVFREHLSQDFEVRVLHDLTNRPYFSRGAATAVADVDLIVIGGGDLVIPWTISDLYWRREYLAKPVFVAGVGVPRWKQPVTPVVERYQAFFQSPAVKWIGARDPDSATWITTDLTPRVPVQESPDLVCALTLPSVIRDPGERVFGLATRRRSPGTEDDYTKLEELVAEVQSQGYRVKHIVLGCGDVGGRDLEDAKRLRTSGVDVVASERMSDLSAAIGSCDVFASMKFHGSVVATMYGIPSLVLVPTDKNRSFMKRIGRNDLLSHYAAPNLIDKIRPHPPAPIDPAAVANLRSQAVAMINNLRDAMLAEISVRTHD